MSSLPTLDLSPPLHVHLVGVGGAGMSGIARMLIQRGHAVSGSDRQEGRALEALRAMGARIRIGHDPSAVHGAEVVVTSSAIAPSNPEIVAARERGLPILHRSEMLAALMVGGRAILIAGTHGKTTTTCMTVIALQAAGHDPSFAIGGALNEAGSNAHAGVDDLFVAEADESDRSFLAFTPDLAVVTNVELDHPDAFVDLDDTLDAFRAFLEGRRPGAPALICADDPGSARLAREASGEVVTYGEDPRATVRVVPTVAPGPPWSARLRTASGDVMAVQLAVPGRHNLLNAAAALAVCWLVSADLAAAANGLRTFTGALRRFQRLGTAGGVDVVDDYAHHPTELRATLAAARMVAHGRVLLVVQPHRFSRTAALGADLGRAAAGADLVVVTDVYGADETPVPGVTGEIVAEAVRQAGAVVRWVPHLGDVAATMASLTRPGDLVVIAGAGDVSLVGPALLATLAEAR